MVSTICAGSWSCLPGARCWSWARVWSRCCAPRASWTPGRWHTPPPSAWRRARTFKSSTTAGTPSQVKLNCPHLSVHTIYLLVLTCPTCCRPSETESESSHHRHRGCSCLRKFYEEVAVTVTNNHEMQQ